MYIYVYISLSLYRAVRSKRRIMDPFGYIQNMQSNGAPLGRTLTKDCANRGDKGRPSRFLSFSYSEGGGRG